MSMGYPFEKKKNYLHPYLMSYSKLKSECISHLNVSDKINKIYWNKIPINVLEENRRTFS